MAFGTRFWLGAGAGAALFAVAVWVAATHGTRSGPSPATGGAGAPPAADAGFESSRPRDPSGTAEPAAGTLDGPTGHRLGGAGTGPSGQAGLREALGRAKAAYAAKRAELMAADPDAVHYLRHADRLHQLAEGISPDGDAGLRRWLGEGPAEQRERRAAAFQTLQDVVLVPEVFEIATNPDTESLFLHAYENGALPERLVLEVEYFRALDELLEFDGTVDLDEAPGDVRHSGEMFIWEFGRRVEAAEAYLGDEARREGVPDAIERAARDLVRADLLAHLAEAYAAKAEYAELAELAEAIDLLEAQLDLE